MDEQRLERALRAGPPFATSHAARPLALEARSPTVPRAVARLVVALAVLALLLATVIAGAVLSGLLRSPVAAVAVAHRDVASCERRTCPTTLSIVDADGHETTIFPPADAGPAEIFEVAWSPDGGRLALVTAPMTEGLPAYELSVIGADGSDRRQLRRLDQGWCGYVDWSLDGRTLACTGDEGDGDRSWGRLMAIDVASGEATVLDVGEPDSSHEQFGPYRWSPNGAWLAYRSYGAGSALWVVRRDGSERRQLALWLPLRNATPEGDARPPRAFSGFAWSPDSDALAFGDYQRGVIGVVALDGQRSTITTGLGSGIEVLAWTRPDQITYWVPLLGASTDQVRTTAPDGLVDGLLIRPGSAMGRGWAMDVDVPWVSTDGRMHWWNRTGGSAATGEPRKCLIAANGSGAEVQLCVGVDGQAHAVGQPNRWWD